MRQNKLGARKRWGEKRGTVLIRSICFLLMFAIGNDEMSQASKEAAAGSGDTSSRLPHHRIAAWARELMDDLQSIEDETDQGQGSPKENNADDLGDSLAVKR
jgi:hypothetical protein